ncbi:mitogen-activated protein kinase kinase 10 [Malania oleifera]|uniref:mitogen-activated protein kinase kinase 10 n=1 Tax=Malania oleifera TaxID=397392 RepID=UPI0025AE7919|nr:mitogen-activated protein kinase kinase 10 [Malania oleifera]
MTLVRERRHQHPLRLSLPPPIPAPQLRHRIPSPSPSPSFCLDSLNIDSLSDLEKLAVLGHGTGGTVYKVRHRPSSSLYALKVLHLGHDALPIRQQAAREAEIFKRVDSQFLVRCHTVFDNALVEADGIDDSLCFVMEYMEAGSLHDVLRVRRRLPEKVISGLARRVLEGLHYLHSMQIVHRDIKPSNLLINGNGDVKIADFGVSRVMAGGGSWEAWESCVGTCAYMSPERIDPEGWGGGDEFAGDVWALGVVVLECHVGHFPLVRAGQKPDWAALMCAICFGEREVEVPETASSEFRSFVRRCLEKDWRNRGTVEELLGHPFTNTCLSCDPIAGSMHAWVLN